MLHSLFFIKNKSERYDERKKSLNFTTETKEGVWFSDVSLNLLNEM